MDVTSFILLKSVFFMKLAVLLFLAKFACFSLAVKLSDVNLLNSWIIINLSWSWSVAILFSILQIFVLLCHSQFSWLNYKISILFPTVVRAVIVVVVAKLSGFLTLTSFILALREALVAKLVISAILSSIYVIWGLYTSFLIT